MKNGSQVRVKKTKYTSKPDMIILVIALILFMIGLLFVLSASWPEAIYNAKEGTKFPGFQLVKRQFIFGLIGICSMIFFANFDYRIFKKGVLPLIGYVSTIALGLSIVFVPSLGREEYGAIRWFSVTSTFGFMPSDFMKIGAIIFVASFLASRDKKINKFWDTFINSSIWVGIPVIVILLQKDLSTAFVLAAALGIMMFISGMNWTYFLIYVMMLPPAYKILFSGEGQFRAKRITAWLDPFGTKIDEGWQIAHSLMALGTGGITGLGIGLSRQKYSYLQFPYNDYIFAIIGEETGLVGTSIVLILFGIFIIRGYRIAQRCDDLFGKYIAVGISSLIGVQAMVNIAVATNTIPATGITLPLISYGGTSLVVVFTCIGILINISRHC